MNSLTCPICDKQIKRQQRSHITNRAHMEYLIYLYNNNITEFNRINKIYKSIY